MTARILLHNRKGEVVGHTLVSKADHEHLSRHRWFLSSHGYVKRREDRRVIYMHREILGLSQGDRREADHVNLNTLDNRRENLRVVTHAQNAANRGMHVRNKSGVRGVYWNAKRSKWIAQTAIGGKTRFLGSFDTLEAASRSSLSAGLP